MQFWLLAVPVRVVSEAYAPLVEAICLGIRDQANLGGKVPHVVIMCVGRVNSNLLIVQPAYLQNNALVVHI